VDGAERVEEQERQQRKRTKKRSRPETITRWWPKLENESFYKRWVTP
jgi:hypothetical protein